MKNCDGLITYENMSITELEELIRKDIDCDCLEVEDILSIVDLIIQKKPFPELDAAGIKRKWDKFVKLYMPNIC